MCIEKTTCAFDFTVGRTHKESCDLEPLEDSEYCVWHDKRAKHLYPSLAKQFEDRVNKEPTLTEGFCLRGAPLRGLTLRRKKLCDIDFEGADLTRSDLRASDLSYSIFRDADLRGADLSECRARGADFRGANLDEANLRGAYLEGALLEDCSHRGTILAEAFLENTILAPLAGKDHPLNDEILRRFMPNPFTPKAGLLPRWFGGRDKAKHILSRALSEANVGNPDHLVVLGEWAIGKTALLLWLKGEAQHQGIWASYVPIPLCNKNSTVDDAISLLVETMSRGFSMGISSLRSFVKTVEGFGFSLAGTGVSLSRKSTIRPMTLLLETFLSLWDDLKTRSTCVAIIIDDIHLIHPAEEVLSVIKQTLVQLTSKHQVNLMVVLASTGNTWLSLTGPGGHTPVGRYFSSPPIMLETLSPEDVVTVIDETLAGTGVTFSETIVRQVQEFTRGHPFDLQIICKILYDAQFGGTVPEAAWAKSKAEAEKWLQRIVTKREQASAH